MRWIEVEASEPLNGRVKIPGSKNSSLALLAAACLADEPVTLCGIPEIRDFTVICNIGQDIGITIRREPTGEVWIDPRGILHTELDHQKTSAYRASYYFVGALLAKYSRISIGYPGGDNFVSRPIDQHIKALTSLGAKFTFFDEHYIVEADRLIGADIYFDTITCGATINAMLAAVLAKGTTVLRNAAVDPEVVDTANLLSLMGANIRGAGTSTIRISGVQRLGGCTYTVIPDRLIAGTFLMAAGATNGCVTIDGIIPEHLGACVAKLKEMGMEIESGDQSMTAWGRSNLRAIRVRTAMYPGFATDLQQPITAIMLGASGRSIIADKIYPQRFSHINGLQRMGAEIEMRGNGTIVIHGKQPLRGALVHATDVRAGVCLIMAGLQAEGKTMITGVEHIERGYDHVVDTFCSLGARMKMHEGDVVLDRVEHFCGSSDNVAQKLNIR